MRIQQLGHVSGAAFLPLYRQESACDYVQQLMPAAMLQPHMACSWHSNLHAALDGQSDRHFSLHAALGCLSVRFGTNVSTHSDTRACGCLIDYHQQLWQEAFDFDADLRPDIPDIIVNFHHDFHFEVTQLHISEISPEMHAAAVSLGYTCILSKQTIRCA